MTSEKIINRIREKHGFISDMDGVIYHGNKILPGVLEFVKWLKAEKKLGCNREETVIIGDRMDTDIVAGIESEIETCLVLSGISNRKIADEFPYRPHYILNGVGDIIKH